MRSFRLIALCVVFVSILSNEADAMRTGKSLLVGLNSKCMTLERKSSENGTKVILTNCTGRPEQNFFVRPIEGHFYEFGILGKCLDVPGRRFENRNQLQIWTCNQSPAQIFMLEGDEPRQQLKVGDGRFCVEVQGGFTREGTPIQLYECNRTRSQDWFAIPVQHQREAPMAPTVSFGRQIVRREGSATVTYETLNAMDLSLFEDGFEFEYRRGRDHTFEPWQMLVPQAPSPSESGRLSRVGNRIAARLPSLESGYVYQFRVRAKNAYGATNSKTLSRAVGDAPLPDLLVRGLSVVDPDREELNIRWQECNLSVRPLESGYETWVTIYGRSPIKLSFPEGLGALECVNRYQNVDQPWRQTQYVRVNIDARGAIFEQHEDNNQDEWPAP